MTLVTARMSTAATPKPSGRKRAASRRVEFLKSFDRSSGMPAAPQRPPNPPRASSAGGLTTSSAGAGTAAVAVLAVLPVAAHAASSSRELGGDDLGVGRTGLEQFVVRAEPDLAAVLDHEDLIGVDDRGDPLGDDDRHRVGDHRHERGAQPRVGGEVERGERVVEQVDARPPDERARDREALPLPARDVGTALADRRVELPGIAETKSRACAISSARHSSSSVASGFAWRRLVATVPVKRYGFCGTRPMRLHSSSGSMSRTSTPSTSTVPPVASNSRGTRLSNVVLPATGAPDDRGGLARDCLERDVAQHRVVGAGIVELHVAQLERARGAERGDRVRRR